MCEINVNGIGELEKEKCRNIVGAFSEYFKQSGDVVVEAGEYGFVLLSDYYRKEFHLVSNVCETGRELFDLLIDSWLDWHMSRDYDGTPVMLSEGIYSQLSDEQRKPYDELKARLYNDCSKWL